MMIKDHRYSFTGMFFPIQFTYYLVVFTMIKKTSSSCEITRQVFARFVFSESVQSNQTACVVEKLNT